MVANSHLASGFALRDRGAHAMHQPERGGVENEPHLIGGRAVTRHAIRRQLRLVQLDQSAARQLIALSQRERRICNYKLQLRCTVQLAPAARSSAHNFSALARLSAPTWTRAQPMLPRASP